MNNYYFLFTLVLLFNYSIRASASASKYYDLDAIKKETGWSGVSVQEFKEVNHLSLISQSPYYYKEKEIDPNYYYPSTAGQGIDIYVIDFGVNFNHEDFEVSDKYYNKRTISCDAVFHEVNGVVEPRIVTDEKEKLYCVSNAGEIKSHGTMAASVAAGNIYGVAKKANIHFLASDNSTKAHKACAEYIIKHATPGKTVVSISSSGIGSSKDDEELLNNLTRNGFIVIVSASNDGRNCCTTDKEINFISYPGYGIAITTGATNTSILNNGLEKAEYTNYGKCVDIFTPGTVLHADPLNGRTAFLKNSGTSCSTPLVAGMAALLMAEHPEYLASPDTPNYFVNNGKRSVYSPSEDIECGISSNGVNHGSCNSGCCSKEGKCVNFENNPWEVCYIENGCQEKYGTCFKKDEIVGECEKLLETHKECLISPKDDINACNDFRSQSCKYFYKHIYADQSVCALVKKDESYKNIPSLAFIYNFTKEKYNDYNDICNDSLKYQESKCKNSFDQCNIKGIENKYSKTFDEIKDMHRRLKENNCYDFYDDYDKLNEKIDESPSCQYVEKNKSYRYLLNDVLQMHKYNNFLHDYILYVLNTSDIYKICNVDNVSDDKIEETCNDDRCHIFYKNNFKEFGKNELNEEDHDLLNRLQASKEAYINKCRSKK
eukprot:jgi/Orpsp1_1/1174784/evm.model.c7180000051413.1